MCSSALHHYLSWELGAKRSLVLRMPQLTVWNWINGIVPKSFITLKPKNSQLFHWIESKMIRFSSLRCIYIWKEVYWNSWNSCIKTEMEVEFCACFLEGGIKQGVHCPVLLMSILSPFKKSVLHEPLRSTGHAQPALLCATEDNTGGQGDMWPRPCLLRLL